MDRDEIAFSFRHSQNPGALEAFGLRARFPHGGRIYQVVTQDLFEYPDDIVVTITARQWPADPESEQERHASVDQERYRRAHPRSASDLGRVPYFGPARAKVLDASAKVRALRAELEDYLAQRPWTSETAGDGSGLRYWQVLRIMEEPPLLHAEMATSDVANKLRSALDNWMYDTVREVVQSDEFDRTISFPIYDRLINFERWVGRSPWLDGPLRDALEVHQPFNTPSKALRWLQALSNSDKHRRPVPVGLTAHSGTFGVDDCPPGVARFLVIDRAFPRGFVRTGTAHGEARVSQPVERLALRHKLNLEFAAEIDGEERPMSLPIMLARMAFEVDSLLRSVDDSVQRGRSGV